MYINKRPCDNQRVIKLINEVYRQYNQSQYPMFILNISLSSKNVDINVTPDKLKIFIKNENLLLALLKASLSSSYSKSGEELKRVEEKDKRIDDTQCESAKKVYNFQFYKAADSPNIFETSIEENVSVSKKRGICENDNDDIIDASDEEPSTAPKKNKIESDTQLFDLCPQYKQTKLNNVIKEATRSSREDENNEKSVLIKTIVTRNEEKASKVPNILFQNNIGSNQCVQNSAKKTHNESYSDKKLFDLNDTLSSKLDVHFNKDFNDDSVCQNERKVQDNPRKLDFNKYMSQSDHDLDVYESEAEILSQSECQKTKKYAIESIVSTDEDEKITEFKTKSELPKKKSLEKTDAATDLDFTKNRKVKEINFSLNNLLKKRDSIIVNTQNINTNKQLKIKFKPKMFDSKEAESELDRYIQKEDFTKMHVCGQFNKGFIVTRLDHDLFIVDQHAADEIYNFEQLQITNKIDKQRLLQPHYLELSQSAETLLIENEQLLEKAGYEIQVIKTRKAGNRIMLTSVPTSKKQNKLFDSNDIDELLFILNENNISCCDESTENVENLQKLHQIKPSSLRALYASKACRKSIMIGDSLNKFEMKRVITHLSEIVKPWNCPHGRPTLRHLINLELYRNIAQE